MIEQNQLFDADVDASLDILRNGGTILYPTDTVWGLGCDATNPEAVDKIYALKNRPAEKACILLLADKRDLLQYVTTLDLEVFNYLDQVTKPTTVVYPQVVGIAENLLAPDGSAAFRIVQEPFCKHLIKRLKAPLVSTSANLSGNPTPAFFHQIDPVVVQGVDYVVHYRREDQTPKSPSAVVRWKSGGEIEVLRP